MASSVVKAAYWLSTSGFQAEGIDSSLFTHLFCAFADLNPNTYEVIIDGQEKQAQFSTFTRKVKGKNSSVKTLLSIGGAKDGVDAIFAKMAKKSDTRKIFIDSSIILARSNEFDGLDLDWEYPKTEDVKNLGDLLKEWRVAVNEESSRTSRARLLLIAATGYSPCLENQWNYPSGQVISTNLDWINVMAYDCYGPGWFKTHTAPPAALHNPRDGKRCVSAGIVAWIRRDVPSEQLVVGLPFYGRAWKLTDANHHGLFAPAGGPAVGQHIDESGAIAYNQLINQNGFKKDFDDQDYVTDYCYLGTTWIGYDDNNSITKKVEYAREKKLRGYFAWQVSGDNDWNLSRAASDAWPAA